MKESEKDYEDNKDYKNHAGGATVISVNISPKKGMRKKPVEKAEVAIDHGIKDDAHAANWHRQISFLAQESIEKMVVMGLNVGPGDFAENITTSGIDLIALPVGAKMSIGNDVAVEVTQIGKECHLKCAIYRQAGDCVMPKEGIFARVVKDGTIIAGDVIRIIEG